MDKVEESKKTILEKIEELDEQSDKISKQFLENFRNMRNAPDDVVYGLYKAQHDELQAKINELDDETFELWEKYEKMQ